MMEIQIEASILQEALEQLEPITTKRSPLPTTNAIKVQSQDNGTLLLETYNFEQGIRLYVPAVKTSKRVRFAVPIHLVRSSLKNLQPKDIVSLRLDHDKLIVETARGIYKFAIIPFEMFEKIPEPDGIQFEIPFELLKQSFRAVIPAVSKDSQRYSLQGVYVDYQEETGHFTCAATDTIRLVFSSIPYQIEHLPEFSSVFPAEFIKLLLAVPTVSETKALLTIKPQEKAWFQFQNGLYYTQLIASQYPNWRRVIRPIEDNPNYTFVDFSRYELVRVLQHLSEFTDKLSKVSLYYDESQKRIVFKYNDDLSEIEQYLDVFEAAPFPQTAFNLELVLPILRQSFEEDRIRFYFDNRPVTDYSPEHVLPITIHGESPDMKRALVMPMRL